MYEEDETLAADADKAGAGAADDDDGVVYTEAQMREAWKTAVHTGAEALAQKLFFDEVAGESDDEPRSAARAPA